MTIDSVRIRGLFDHSERSRIGIIFSIPWEDKPMSCQRSMEGAVSQTILKK